MENTINTDTRYIVTERLGDRRFAAKMYEWQTHSSVVNSCDYADVEIGIRNNRNIEYVVDVTFTAYEEFAPKIGETYMNLSRRHLAYDISKLKETLKPTGREIVWDEPFVSYFSEDNGSMQDVNLYSVDELFDVVSKMKNVSTERTVINESA